MYLNIKGKNDYQLEGSAGTFTQDVFKYDREYYIALEIATGTFTQDVFKYTHFYTSISIDYDWNLYIGCI